MANSNQLTSKQGAQKLKCTDAAYQILFVCNFLKNSQVQTVIDERGNTWLCKVGLMLEKNNEELFKEINNLFLLNNHVPLKKSYFHEGVEQYALIESIDLRKLHYVSRFMQTANDLILYKLDYWTNLAINSIGVNLYRMPGELEFLSQDTGIFYTHVDKLDSRNPSAEDVIFFNNCNSNIDIDGLFSYFDGLEPYQTCKILAWMVNSLFTQSESVLLNLYGGELGVADEVMGKVVGVLAPEIEEIENIDISKANLNKKCITQDVVCLSNALLKNQAAQKKWLDVLTGFEAIIKGNKRKAKDQLSLRMKRSVIMTSKSCATVNSVLFDHTMPLKIRGECNLGYYDLQYKRKLLLAICQLASLRITHLSRFELDESFGRLDSIVKTAKLIGELQGMDINKIEKSFSADLAETMGGYLYGFDEGFEARSLSEMLSSLPEENGMKSGIDPFDRFFDKGLQPGSMLLLTGEPGSGKSTLALQLAEKFQTSAPVLYYHGEEGANDIARRAKRLNVGTDSSIMFLRFNCLDKLTKEVVDRGAKFLIVDSIKTLTMKNSTKSNDTTDIVSHLYSFCKENNLIVIALNHVNKKGQSSGKQELAHIVDCHMHLSKADKKDVEENHLDANGRLSKLTAIKNRFGSCDLVSLYRIGINGIEFL